MKTNLNLNSNASHAPCGAGRAIVLPLFGLTLIALGALATGREIRPLFASQQGSLSTYRFNWKLSGAALCSITGGGITLSRISPKGANEPRATTDPAPTSPTKQEEEGNRASATHPPLPQINYSKASFEQLGDEQLLILCRQLLNTNMEPIFLNYLANRSANRPRFLREVESLCNPLQRERLLSGVCLSFKEKLEKNYYSIPNEEELEYYIPRSLEHFSQNGASVQDSNALFSQLSHKYCYLLERHKKFDPIDKREALLFSYFDVKGLKISRDESACLMMSRLKAISSSKNLDLSVPLWHTY